MALNTTTIQEGLTLTKGATPGQLKIYKQFYRKQNDAIPFDQLGQNGITFGNYATIKVPDDCKLFDGENDKALKHTAELIGTETGLKFSIVDGDPTLCNYCPQLYNCLNNLARTSILNFWLPEQSSAVQFRIVDYILNDKYCEAIGMEENPLAYDMSPKSYQLYEEALQATSTSPDEKPECYFNGDMKDPLKSCNQCVRDDNCKFKEYLKIQKALEI